MAFRVAKSLRAAALVAALAGMAGAGATVPAWSQVAGFGQTVALTPETVGNFVASFPQVEALANQLDDEYDVQPGVGDSPGDALSGYMAYQGAIAQFDQLVQRYGFAGFMEWMPVMTSVVSAWTFAEQGGDMDAQMAAAIEQIQSNPSLSDAQKTMLLEQLGVAAASLGATRPPQENIDAVAPYAEELEALFNS